MDCAHPCRVIFSLASPSDSHVLCSPDCPTTHNEPLQPAEAKSGFRIPSGLVLPVEVVEVAIEPGGERIEIGLRIEGSEPSIPP